MLHWIYWIFGRGTAGKTISTIVDDLKAEIWKHFQWLKHTNISLFELQTELIFFLIYWKYFRKYKTQVKIYLLPHQNIIPAWNSKGHVPLLSHCVPAVLWFRVLCGLGNVLVSKVLAFFLFSVPFSMLQDCTVPLRIDLISRNYSHFMTSHFSQFWVLAFSRTSVSLNTNHVFFYSDFLHDQHSKLSSNCCLSWNSYFVFLVNRSCLNT